MNKEDLREFFKHRMVEALHKDTLDSFRVRTNNSITILYELSNVVEGWLEGHVKNFNTVESCINEAIDIIKRDESLIFPYYNKDLFIKKLIEFRKGAKENDVSTTKSIICLVDMLYSSNKDHYLLSILDKLSDSLNITEEILDSDFITSLDKFNFDISSFCCELLRLGYSKVYLYNFFKAFLYNKKKESFKDAFNDMKSHFTNREKKGFHVIFKIEFTNRKSAENATTKIDNIKESVPSELQDHITKQNTYKITNERIRFYITKKEALDSGMAIRLSYEELSNDFDINLESINEVRTPSTALIIADQNIRLEKIYYFDNGENLVDTDEMTLGEAINRIKSKENISKDILDRLHSSLRHLRIGDQQSEVEQRFINYWISIEFIFSSTHSKESTFERIKTFLPEILECSYVKRNILYMNKWLLGKKMISNNESWHDLNDDKKQEILTSVDILTKYRLQKLKSHLHHKDKRKNYLQAHKTNVERHITRIYRLRNELIHEAAIKQDIANVTSNLRFYLVFILNQLISFLLDDNKSLHEKEISHFFWMYDNLSNFIKTDYDLTKLMDVPLTEKFII